MKRILFALLLSSVSAGAFAGVAQSVQFNGLVRNDSAVPVRFDVQIPARQRATLLLNDGSRLEFFTPGSPGHAKSAEVRLVSATGKILHRATYGASVASRSLDYLVCNGRVTYMSPAPAKLPACAKH